MRAGPELAADLIRNLVSSGIRRWAGTLITCVGGIKIVGKLLVGDRIPVQITLIADSAVGHAVDISGVAIILGGVDKAATEPRA